MADVFKFEAGQERQIKEFWSYGGWMVNVDVDVETKKTIQASREKIEARLHVT
jgi:hypothetical protein